jgi:hypothetical protein
LLYLGAPMTIRRASLALVTPLFAFAIACGSSSDTSPGGSSNPGADSGAPASSGGGGSSGGGSSSGGSGSSSGGNDASTPVGDGSPGGAGGDASAPPTFWDDGNTPPAAKNVMTFQFLNRTNGKFQDSEVYWSFKNASAGISETHSIAEAPTYDMPANASGRMYFYLCAAGDPTNCTGDPTKSKYYDFIEHTIGATQYNGNTTRVDAFGLKIAMRLHCADGYDVAVGEDYATFAEDRAVTFQKFLDDVPDEFKPLAQPPYAPYRIVEPGAAGFGQNGANAAYYNAFIDAMWANNGLTVPKPGPNGSGLGAYPNLSAAIFRHVGDKAGTFSPDGKLLDNTLWGDATTFYTAAPANYYARFWHEHGLNGKAYGFPYDDVGGYSSYVSHKNPQYMKVAIGW